MVKMADTKWLKNCEKNFRGDVIDLVDCIDVTEPEQEQSIRPLGRGRGIVEICLKTLTIPLLQSDADDLNSNLSESTGAKGRSKGRGRRLKCGGKIAAEASKAEVETIIGVLRTENATFAEEFPALGGPSTRIKLRDAGFKQDNAGQYDDAEAREAPVEEKLNVYSMKSLKKLQPRDSFLIVDGLPCSAELKDVRSLFGQFGDVLSCEMKHEQSLALLQRAVICMNSKKSCERAISALRGSTFGDTTTAMSIERLTNVIRREDDLRFHLFK